MRYLVTGDGKAFGLHDDGRWSPAPSSGSALELLRGKPLSGAIVAAVRGLFGTLGIRVIETGEELTCTHSGNAIAFTAGIDPASTDVVLPMHLYQVERLVGFFTDGILDDLEMFYITRALFADGHGPRHLLGNPLVANPVLRRMIRGKRLLHITLLSPDLAADHDALFTMAFVSGQWLVVSGHHGLPERVLRVPVSEAIELQRLFFAGMKAGDLGTWMKIARSYVAWRDRVEVPQ
jgi:hypothetical protein